MENKQKLPKHITAHVDLFPSDEKSVVLKNEKTGKCAYAFVNIREDVEDMFEFLESGFGWEYDKTLVGKQIVF